MVIYASATQHSTFFRKMQSDWRHWRVTFDNKRWKRIFEFLINLFRLSISNVMLRSINRKTNIRKQVDKKEMNLFGKAGFIYFPLSHLVIRFFVIFVSLHRIISPDVLPSCSPGVFRQKSFRSSSNSTSTTTTTLSSAGVATTGNQCDHVQTTKRSSSNHSRNNEKAEFNNVSTRKNNELPCLTNTDNSANRLVEKSVNNNFNQETKTSSRIGLPASEGGGTRALRNNNLSTKHSRRVTVLANKMASASSNAVVQGWPNTKDDYDLKEVIGKYSDKSFYQ